MTILFVALSFSAAGLFMLIEGILDSEMSLIQYGSFLAMVGVFDIGVMIYCIKKKML